MRAISGNNISTIVFVLSISIYPLVSALVEFFGFENPRVLTIPYRGVILSFSIFFFVSFIDRKLKRGGVEKTVWFSFWFLYTSRIIVDYFLNPASLSKEVNEYLLYALGVCFIPATVLLLWGELDEGVIDLLIPIFAIATFCNMFIVWQAEGYASFSHMLNIRGETETLNPISFGHLSVSLIALSMTQLIKEKFRLKTPIYIILMALGLIGMVISGSRGPVLSLLVVVLAYMLTKNRKLILFLPILAFVLLFNDYIANAYLTNRLMTSLFSDDVRFSLLSNSIKLFLDNPVFGAGIDPLSVYPHNLIVESFMAIGLFGGILFLGLLFLLIYHAFILLKTNEYDWLSLLFLQYLVASFFSGSIYESVYFWVLGASVLSSAKL